MISFFSFFFLGGGYLLRIIWNWSKGNGMGESEINNKYCQRNKGPRGWVLSSKYLRQVISQVDQNSASKSQPYLSIKISTKHLPQSLDQTSTSKNLPKFNLKVFNENILQNHDQTLVSKPWQYIALKALTKIKVQILYQTSASKSWPNCRQHSINISNTNNLNSTQVKSVSYFNNSSQLVSEWVNQSVSDKGTQRSDLGKYNVCQHM